MHLSDSDALLRNSKVVWLGCICYVRRVRSSQIHSKQTRSRAGGPGSFSSVHTLREATAGFRLTFFLSFLLRKPLLSFCSSCLTAWLTEIQIRATRVLLHESWRCEQLSHSESGRRTTFTTHARSLALLKRSDREQTSRFGVRSRGWDSRFWRVPFWSFTPHKVWGWGGRRSAYTDVTACQEFKGANRKNGEREEEERWVGQVHSWWPAALPMLREVHAEGHLTLWQPRPWQTVGRFPLLCLCTRCCEVRRHEAKFQSLLRHEPQFNQRPEWVILCKRRNAQTAAALGCQTEDGGNVTQEIPCHSVWGACSV